MPRPQTVHPEHILVCAADLFEQHGFDGVTTQAIARAAGVSEGALFRYFHSKDDLFTAALMVRAGAPSFFEELQALVACPEDQSPPLVEGLERTARAASSFYQKAVRSIAVLVTRMGGLPSAPVQPEQGGPPRGPAVAHLILTEYFRRLERRGEVVPGDARARASAYLSGLFGYAFVSAFLQGTPDAAAPGEERAPVGAVPAWMPDAEAFRRQFVADFVRGVAVRPEGRSGSE